MANINSLMTNSSSSTSSLYGTRNVLSGLASGMDTEAMIENSVSGYKTKLTQLQQQQTKYEWKQDAYRGITDKLYEMNQKYTSYTSKTNLYSEAFFNNSIVTTAVSASAEAASMVSATGRSSSDIQILAAQAATAASYSVKASDLGLTMPGMTTADVTRSDDSIKVGQLKGSFTLNYDGQTVDISFDESDLINATDANGNVQTLAKTIEKKLSEVNINTSKYGAMKASDVIKVGVENGKLTFSENTANIKQGANPYVSYIDSKLGDALGAVKEDLYAGSSTKKYSLSDITTTPSNPSVTEYLTNRTINVVVDGVSKSFELKGLQADSSNPDKLDMDSLVAAFKKGFQDIGAKIGVDVTDDGNALKFTPPNATSAISISAKDDKANELLGLSAGVGNYINDKTSIATLLGSQFDFDQSVPAKEEDTAILARLNGASADSDGYITDKTTGNRYQKVAEGGDSVYYRVNSQNPPERLFELKINDKSVYISKNDSLESVMNAINNSDMGVKAAYSKLTGNFTFTAKEAGSAGNISFDNDLSKRLFGSTMKQLTLGDVLDDSWFTEDPDTGEKRVTLYASGNINADTPAKGSYSKDTSLSVFLKDFNEKSNTVQLMDSSSNNDVGHAKSDALDGYNLKIEKWGTGDGTNIAGLKLANGTNASAQSMNLTDFVNVVNKANAGATKGQDAQIRALVNGEAVNLTRSSNTIELDGMSLTLKGSFGERDANGGLLTGAATEAEKSNAISFTTSGGSDDMIKTIREFVDEYNAALKRTYDAFATQPAEKSSSTHAKYEPLTDDDKSTMSESAIKSYEDKAKQGILFGDSDLRGLYQSMVNAISPGGNDGAILRSIGIETSYSGNVTQIKLNESKLREALESDPDKVRDAFTKNKEYGASTNGLMSSIKTTLDKYASASISSPGVLVKKAGSTFSSTSLLSNAMQKQIDSVQTQIEKWQSKMSVKIDYYTRQFTALEKLMNTMNSQSSALSGLMGGY